MLPHLASHGFVLIEWTEALDRCWVSVARRTALSRADLEVASALGHALLREATARERRPHAVVDAELAKSLAQAKKKRRAA